ncbi:MAG: hypothetical protein LBE56_08580 [Tannerella sp.]|jgi:hypothetical protein|nr:hypothetical protein [Tannerella sp.]
MDTLIEAYHLRLHNTVSAVLETDLSAVENIEFISVQKLKRLLSVNSNDKKIIFAAQN